MFQFKPSLKSALITAITFILPSTGVDQVYFSALLTDVVIVSFGTRLADQCGPQSLQGAAVEDVGFKANSTQFFYLQPDGTLLNASNVATSVLANN